MADKGRLDALSKFGTYEEFLDSQITALDLYYLEDEEVARRLVALGYRGSGDVLTREEFDSLKKKAEAEKISTRLKEIKTLSTNKDIQSVFVKALAEREVSNRKGKLNTIIFILDETKQGHGLSGYIDYSHRLKTDNFESIFMEKRKLLPHSKDLSFYNWHTKTAVANDTPNFWVISQNIRGLILKSKIDRKVIDVDPKAPSPGENTTRIEIKDPSYQHIVIFDHVIRRKI